MLINFSLNGQARRLECDGGRRVLDLLREEFGLTGTKEACGSGECGACSVLIDGESRLSCLMLACQLEGREIVTVEGFSGQEGELHPLQQALVEKGAVQCGYCTPGMLVAASDLLARNPHPAREEIRAGLSGNLCRCTGYQKIVDAVAAAAETIAETRAPGSGAVSGLALDPRDSEITGDNGLLAGEKPEPAENVDSPDKRTESREGIWMSTTVLQPATLAELLEMRRRYPRAVLMAGGTDLLVWRRDGRIAADTIILIAGIPEMQKIEVLPGELIIGSGIRIQEILEQPEVREGWPLLVQALEKLGSPPVRHMATLGGNICSASPAGDSLPALYVLEASLEIAGAAGRRTAAIHEFISGPGQNGLQPGECLLAVRIPRPKAGQICGFEKVGQREALAIAIASLAYSCRLDQQGYIQSLRLAWGSLGPVVMRFPDIEARLQNRRLDRELIEEWAPRIAERVEPISDVRASAGYRRLLAGRLLYRLLEQAAVPAAGLGSGPQL